MIPSAAPSTSNYARDTIDVAANSLSDQFSERSGAVKQFNNDTVLARGSSSTDSTCGCAT